MVNFFRHACIVLALFTVPSNRVISSLEGKFGTVGDTFVLVLEPLFMKISNLCKNQFVNGIFLKICVK
jgi:hypothetical protein